MASMMWISSLLAGSHHLVDEEDIIVTSYDNRFMGLPWPAIVAITSEADCILPSRCDASAHDQCRRYTSKGNDSSLRSGHPMIELFTSLAPAR